MKRLPMKLMTSAALLTVMTTASIAPSYAFAEESKEVSPQNQQQSSLHLPDKYLGPEGLQKALQDTGSHVVVLDAYALTLLKSPSIKLDKNLFTDQKDKDLVDSVENSQKTAQGHVKNWTDVLKPKLIQVNQGIVNYGTKFDNYYKTIADAANNQDKNTVKQGVQRLYKSVEENKQAVEQLVADLKSFRDSLITDTNNFQQNTNTLLASLEGKNAILPTLQKEIDAYNTQTNVAIGMIAGGGVLCLEGVGFGVLTGVLAVSGIGLPFAVLTGITTAGAVGGGVALIVTGNNKLKDANNNIAKLTTQMKDTDLQAAALKVASGQTKTFSDTINLAIDSAQALADQWTTMDAKYKSLLDNVDTISPENLVFIKDDLKTAQDSWLNIKAYADTLYAKITVKQ